MIEVDAGKEERRERSIWKKHNLTPGFSSGWRDHPLGRMIPTSGISSLISSPVKVIFRFGPAIIPSPE